MVTLFSERDEINVELIKLNLELFFLVTHIYQNGDDHGNHLYKIIQWL